MWSRCAIFSSQKSSLSRVVLNANAISIEWKWAHLNFVPKNLKPPNCRNLIIYLIYWFIEIQSQFIDLRGKLAMWAIRKLFWFVLFNFISKTMINSFEKCITCTFASSICNSSNAFFFLYTSFDYIMKFRANWKKNYWKRCFLSCGQISKYFICRNDAM